MPITDRITALIKYLLSFTKKDWHFSDYPIRTWKNPNAGEDKIAYGAGFANWSVMVGHGENAEKAIADLKKRFAMYKGELPRPGTNVPLKFESTYRIDQYRDIGKDFLHRIFGLDYDKGFYSDGSALEYFMPLGETPENFKRQTIERVRKTYNIDIEQIYERPLWAVFKRVKEEGAPKSTVREGMREW